MIRPLFRRFIQPLLWWAYSRYSAKTRWYTRAGLRLCIQPTVFHPSWMLTTTTLLRHIQTLPIREQKVLELGAGNGLVALWCARAGAQVTASDINPAAVESIRTSAESNNLTISVIRSNLFTRIPSQKFDYIFVNPPYFPEEASNHQEAAFFCGPNFEYFHDFFSQLGTATHPNSQVLMILTDDCDLAQIKAIGQQRGWAMQLVHEHKTWGEWHYIFTLIN